MKFLALVFAVIAHVLIRQHMEFHQALGIEVLVSLAALAYWESEEDPVKARYKEALRDIASNDAACGKPFAIARKALGDEERTPDW